MLNKCGVNKMSPNYGSGKATLMFDNGSLFLQGGKWEVG